MNIDLNNPVTKTVIKSFVNNWEAENKRRLQSEKLLIEEHEMSIKRHWWNRAAKPESILLPEEKRLLKTVKSRAHFLDRGVSLCCLQIGFDGLVGFIPVVGDFIGVLLSLQLVYMCMQANLPKELVSRMILNVAIDFMVGFVPGIGDVLDVLYKCNTKNALLFENYLLRRRRAQRLKEQKTPLLKEA